ncbi:MAG: SDR family NAD(P)-dependent oxidoreductase [Thermoguttaceae bacterium]|nr:SDR family NAD(P)-dependent oxidoreductase [Thermoguttaceae bacterium]
MSSDTKCNQGKNVLVTGGGRGIGRGIVESLAADGWNVVLCGRSDPSRYADFVESIRQKYLTSVTFLSHDISDVEGHDAFLREVYRQVGRLDALVNNAGVAPLVRADILEASVESFDRVLGINLRGPYFLTQKVAQQFLRDKEADSAFSPMIVNIGSISATTVSTSRGEYCVSKAGVAMMSRLFAARLAAAYSRGKASGRVPVDYTLRRYVKKPAGARPGFVIYTNQHTLYVQPMPHESTEV